VKVSSSGEEVFVKQLGGPGSQRGVRVAPDPAGNIVIAGVMQKELEAVPERLELKHEVFKRFEEHVSSDAVLASNTSGIPITKIAEACAHPRRVVGMHWSNPPHLIPMIEVIPGEDVGRSSRHAGLIRASAARRREGGAGSSRTHPLRDIRSAWPRRPGSSTPRARHNVRGASVTSRDPAPWSCSALAGRHST
jgi:hypothetical protein